MKYITITTLFILFAQFLHAQETESPRSFVLGGSVSFSTQTNGYPFSLISLPGGGLFTSGSDDNKSTYLSLAPYVGKQLSDRWMAGIELRYQYRRYTDEEVTITFPVPETYTYRRDNNDIGIGLFARYSFMPENRFDFFLQPFGEYFTLNEKIYVDDDLDSEEKAHYIAVGSDLGVMYNFNDRWCAILRIGGLRYIDGSWETVGTTEGNDFSSFGLSASLASLGIGVEVRM